MIQYGKNDIKSALKGVEGVLAIVTNQVLTDMYTAEDLERLPQGTELQTLAGGILVKTSPQRTGEMGHIEVELRPKFNFDPRFKCKLLTAGRNFLSGKPTFMAHACSAVMVPGQMTA
eukprot:TRINITY_DN3746_c0_g1_i2.p2 TRINITY_DN3746_c0_g1~~TRINITY_DN3746_c0_g1_i2.p2  ORF type:complete len:117 (+),score=32.04 TRINITY_DN3746_c0_g1_i2:430-780(+)